MTVFFDKARGRWRYDFVVGGERHARECLAPDGQPVASRRAATEIEAEARRQAKMAPKLPTAGNLTFGEVMNALSDGWLLRTGWKDRAPIVRELLEFFGPGTPMRGIDGARIQDYVTFALSRPLRVWQGGPTKTPGKLANRWKAHPSGRTRSLARVNRAFPLLRAAFNRAYNTRDPINRERAIDEIPVIKDLPEVKRKARPVPESVLARLQEILPPHIIDGLVVTLCCGFRRNEAFSLMDPQVDWLAYGVRLAGEDVKDSEDAFLPVSQFAIGYLRCLAMEADARRTRYLITWRPAKTEKATGDALRWRPIKSPKTAWKTAMRTITEEFGARWRWHDVRAAFITHVAITCGPLAAQRLARHSDFSTTQAYVEVADQVMREAAEHATARPALGIVAGGKK